MPKYSTHISHVSLRWKITDCSLNEAFALDKSFIPNHAAMAEIATNGTQKNAAFCSQICFTSAPLVKVCASPNANALMVTTTGTTNCTTDTPRLPRPALMPSAVPFSAFGKKKLILLMDELKFALPKPHNKAQICICHNGVFGSCTAKPKPSKGISKVAVENAVQRRPPKIGTTKE